MPSVPINLDDRILERAAKYGNRFPPDERLERAERFINRCLPDNNYFYGIVGAFDNDLDRGIRFLNAGDTYMITVCQEDEGKLFVSSWGDWYEQAENETCEENNVVRCGYCSHFTPLIEGLDWADVVCESCSHKVGG